MSAMHDIQSPLAVLQMATQSLQEVNERYFTFANEAVQQIRDIATDFMERYQMPEQTMIEQCDTIALAPMLLTSVLLKQQLFSTRDIHFECQTPNAADHIYVRANSSLLKRLLSNLLNNAIEAIEHKGHITVSLSYDTERVNFSIKDNGCGINKRDLKTILTHGISLGKIKMKPAKAMDWLDYRTNMASQLAWYTRSLF